MSDKIFISKELFNCPLCKGQAVRYSPVAVIPFNKSKDSQERMLFVKCQGCERISAYILDESKGDFAISWKSKDVKASQELKCSIFGHYKVFSNYIDNQTDFAILSQMTDENVKERVLNFFYENKNIPEEYKTLMMNAKLCQIKKMNIGSAAYLRKLMVKVLTKERVLRYVDGTLDYMKSIEIFERRYPSAESKWVNTVFAAYKLLSDFLKDGKSMEMEEADLEMYFGVVNLLLEVIFVEKKKEKSGLEIRKKLGLK